MNSQALCTPPRAASRTEAAGLGAVVHRGRSVSGLLCTKAVGLRAGRAQRPFGLGAVVHETMLETCSIWGPHSRFYFVG